MKDYYLLNPKTGFDLAPIVIGLSFADGNILKYLLRMGRKPGTEALEDAEKMLYYTAMSDLSMSVYCFEDLIDWGWLSDQLASGAIKAFRAIVQGNVGADSRRALIYQAYAQLANAEGGKDEQL